MAKYPKEIKQKAVEMAKEGIALKVIQNEIGPNPKATMRYLAKEGIDYKDLKEQLKAEGKLQGVSKKQKTEKEKVSKKGKAEPVVEKKQAE